MFTRRSSARCAPKRAQVDLNIKTDKMITRMSLFIGGLCVLALGCGMPLDEGDQKAPPFGSVDSSPDTDANNCLPIQLIPLDDTLPRKQVERAEAKLRVAQSCDDVARWTIKQHTERWLPWYHRSEPYQCMPVDIDDSEWVDMGSGVMDMSAPPIDPDQPSGPDDYSMTNVQDRGVDEPDIIKSNGRYIYKVQRQTVKVFKSWPVEEAAEIATIDEQLFGELRLMLSGERLIVISGGGQPTIMIYDVSDPAAPLLLQRIALSAEMTHVRMIKDRIHFVMQSQWGASYEVERALEQHALPPSLHSPAAEVEQRIEQSRHRIHEDLDAMLPLEDTRDKLPIAWLGLPNETLTPTPIYDDCAGAILLNDALPANAQLVSLVSINIADLSDIKATGAFMAPELFYTSTNALYIATNRDSPHYALEPSSQGTQLYAFDLSRGEAATYSAHGVTAGQILPDLGMSEHAGHLRVFANAASGTQLTIFKVVGDVLEQVGELTGIAPGEQATAARMSGDRLYVLTAKGSGITSPALPPEHPEFIYPSDPLFVIDAAEPTAPKLLGQLDFPGFSAYVHLIGRDHLLSLGRDEQLRLRLQLFDVTDTSNPALLQEHTVDNPGYIHESEAQGDRLRFVYHASRNLLALPVREQDTATRQITFKGQLLFDASAAGINPIGRVEHERFPTISCSGSWCDSKMISASLFIEDYLYSFSDVAFMIHDAGARPVVEVSGAAYAR
jgi:hypothetical protein